MIHAAYVLPYHLHSQLGAIFAVYNKTDVIFCLYLFSLLYQNICDGLTMTKRSKQAAVNKADVSCYVCNIYFTTLIAKAIQEASENTRAAKMTNSLITAYSAICKSILCYLQLYSLLPRWCWYAYISVASQFIERTFWNCASALREARSRAVTVCCA
jgi:hypothetical protein